MKSILSFSDCVKNDIQRILSGVDSEIPNFSVDNFISFGKGVRSRFCYILGEIFSLSQEKRKKIAVSSELLHTASLLHDDCIDGSDFRRGKETLRRRLGTNFSILFGDLLMSFAFENVESMGPKVSSHLVYASREMVRGALIEEGTAYSIVPEETYVKIISLKTSSIFTWISNSICMLSGKMEFLNAAFQVARNAGIVFQIADDILDFETSGETGKDMLKDIMGGKVTLPVILMCKDRQKRDLVEQKLREIKQLNYPDLSCAVKIAEEIKKGGYDNMAREYARRFISNSLPAVERLPQSSLIPQLKEFLHSLLEREK